MKPAWLVLAALLGQGPPAAAAAPAEPGRYPSEEALRRYAQGRLLEERGDKVAALDEYYRALTLAPRAFEIVRRVSEVASHLGDPGRSLEFAEKALVLDPSDARSLWLQGTALLNLGRDREALEPLRVAARADSERVEYVRTLARAAERLEQFDLMAESYRKVVWLDEEDSESWFQLAAAEARRGRFGAADTALRVAAAANPLRPGVFLLQGWVAEGLGEGAKASESYRRHLEIHPNDQNTRRRRVFLLARQKLHAEAAAEAKVVALARPGDVEARQVEADLLFQAGSDEEAMRRLDDLRKEQPGNVEALAAQVSVLSRHGKSRRAVAEAERWLIDHPGDLRAMMVAARARELNRDLPEAVRHYERAIAAAPDSIGPRAMLARAYEGARRLAEAERVWRAAVERFPRVDALAYDLALCREKLGDLAGAEHAIRDVLARSPDNPTALNFLGYLFADHNRKLDEAVALITKALKADPDNGAYLDSLGWAYYRLGRLAEARRELERALQVGASDPIIHEHLGDVYKSLRLNQLAKDQYLRSLALDGTNERVKSKLSSIR